MVIFDTNILIELYRGNQVLRGNISHLRYDVFYVSSITIAEFVIGAKDKDDLQKIEKQLRKYT